MARGKEVIKVTIRAIVFASALSVSLMVIFLPRHVEGTGGAFPNTEHGGTDATYPDRGYYPITDNVTGVSRGHLDAYYSTDYNRGECVHCHEPHASYVGQEPVPNWASHGLVGEGPDQFMLFADYSSKSTRVDFCGYCHTEEDPDANGNPFDTPSDYSFQGATKFKSTAHYQPQFGRNPVQWPGGSRGSTYPAKSSSDSGTCVNCHSPHGYPYSSSDVIASSGTPYPKQLVELTDINNKNPGTSPITTWPNVAGRDPDDAEDLCYTCHISSVVQNKDLLTYNSAGTGYTGSTGIYEAFQQAYHHPVKDSEQTGKTSYYQANPAKPMDIHYAVECTTCHNPHLASGRWDDASSANPSPTPVVLPGVTHKAFQSGLGAYDWPPTSWGLSYQLGDLWGDDPSEKINALLQRFPNRGTGGWQFNINRGYPEGATNMPFDQYPVYQAPKGGTSSGQYQPDGNALPDYITFCLDCHQHEVGTHKPIYWGAGFPPGVDISSCDATRDYVCSEPHGFDAANSPGTGGACCGQGYASCSNPDYSPAVGSPMYGQPRGRGFTLFTRPPYMMEDRIAGINYVLSCTDCHEPHGSSRSSLFRPVVNGDYVNDQTHNEICNACHYYYGGEMMYSTDSYGCPSGGMKGCSTASCHLMQSLHRIDKNDINGSVVLYNPSCPPASGTTFNFNEAAGSATVTDTSGKVTGQVCGNGTNGNTMTGSYFSGDNWDNTIDFVNNSTCFMASDNLTLEARIYPTGIPADASTGIADRIFSRPCTYFFAVWRWYSTDLTPPNTFNPPAGTASIIFRYMPSTVADANACTNSYFHVVVTNYSDPDGAGGEGACPIVNNHWYKVRVVYDKNKSTIPVDIFVDDEGTDGNGTGENWSGYINCTDTNKTFTVGNSTKEPFPGEVIKNKNDYNDPWWIPDYSVGSSSSGTNTVACDSTPSSGAGTGWFLGNIDWLTIKRISDYSGIDGGPQ